MGIWKYPKRLHVFSVARRPWALSRTFQGATGGTGPHNTGEELYESSQEPPRPPVIPPPGPPVVVEEPPVELPCGEPNVGDAIGYPAHLDIFGVSTRSAPSTNMECSACFVQRDITFNRMHMECTAFSGVPTLSFAIWQFPGGELNDGTFSCPKLVESLNVNMDIGLRVVTFPETTLECGYYWIGVGRASGGGTTCEYRVHQLSTNAVWTGAVTGGTRHFVAVPSPSAPPSDLNLASVTAAPNGPPVHRFFKV